MINNNDLIIKKLTEQGIISIYTAHSIRHFPANERKPVSAIRRMVQEGIYIGYGLYEKKEAESLLCYAFFTMLPNCGNILLDYYAVMEQYRSRGIGSYFLQQLKKEIKDYEGILIETENPDYSKDDNEKLVRSKRITFYEGNGAFFTGILAEVFGVHYKVFFLPVLKTPTQKKLLADFDAIYRHMLSQENYETHVRISAT
ncbi:MAG: N-acetyltransferase [Clostridiales bacterium]|nr:N-acetyltransferase [Clostridiales bacterium]